MHKISSFVYVFDYGGFVKVGVSKNPKNRESMLNSYYKCRPLKRFKVECIEPFEVELEIKNKFNEFNANVDHYKTECFLVDFDSLVKEVKKTADSSNEYNCYKYTGLGFYPLRIEKREAKEINNLKDSGFDVDGFIREKLEEVLVEINKKFPDKESLK